MLDIKTLKKEFNLNQLYKEYNTKYFNGKLGDVVFDTYTVGEDEIFSYALENTRKKRNGEYVANIKFNSKCGWNNLNIRETLLHEMIHYYVFVKLGRCPLFEHGIFFKLVQLKLLIYHGIYVPNRGGHKIKKED